MPHLLNYIGEDHIVIGSDYGHNDPSKEPEFVKHMRAREDVAPPDYRERFCARIRAGFMAWTDRKKFHRRHFRRRGRDDCHSAAEAMIVMVYTSRLRATCFLLMVCFVIFVVERRETLHAAQLDAVNLSYSALVPSGAPFWIAQDLKLFEKEGLKTQLLYINAAPRVMAAILAGEVQISLRE